MSFFDVLILDTVLILCPFGLIFILKLKNKHISKIEENYLIDIACFSAFFLLLKYSNYSSSYGLILINIPLIISYLYKRRAASFFLTVLTVLFYYSLGFTLSVVLIEYILYYIIFVFTRKKEKDVCFLFLVFLFIKGICLTVDYYYILGNNNMYGLFQVFVSLIVFYLLGTWIINIINMTNDLVSFNKVLKDFEKEKSLKKALFKITHEVKNPIAVCKGYLSMMNYDDITKVKKYNGIIEKELNRTLDIMDNFSEYTKINVNLDMMDFNYLVKDTISSMRHYIKDNNINLEYEYDDEEIFIKGDYERLKQVIVNIIKNSVEALNEKGTIKVDVKKNRKSVSLQIRDNGCGIPKKELKKIGELFYSSKEKGCGIGVPISKEIINLHNGFLKYSSKEGEYTKVAINIPLMNN